MNEKQIARIKIYRKLVESRKKVVMVGKINPTEAIIFIDRKWLKK